MDAAAAHLRCRCCSSLPLLAASPHFRPVAASSAVRVVGAARWNVPCCSKGHLLRKRLPVSRFTTAVCSQHKMSTSSEESKKEKLLMDCGEDQECVLGGIVALGKFDALHIGHRQLAVHASKAGAPFLLSFVGIAEVLAWEYRPPIVAKCDRKRVLQTWAPYCGNIIPLEYQVEFSKVRHLSPRQFVEKLASDLRVSGVIAGENYRFGYKASGDAVELVRLCEEFGLSAFIVSSVMDKAPRSYNGNSHSINSNDAGQVSSSRVRHALAMGDMEYVSELLGRKHRLIMALNADCLIERSKIVLPRSSALNLPPADGTYRECDLIVNSAFTGRCTVTISSNTIDIKLEEGNIEMPDVSNNEQYIGIELG